VVAAAEHGFGEAGIEFMELFSAQTRFLQCAQHQLVKLLQMLARALKIWPAPEALFFTFAQHPKKGKFPLRFWQGRDKSVAW